MLEWITSIWLSCFMIGILSPLKESYLNYFAYVSKKQGYDPNYPNFTQAMRSEQVGEWIKACAAELLELAQ